MTKSGQGDVDPQAATVAPDSDATPGGGTMTESRGGRPQPRAVASLDAGARVGRYHIEGVLGRGGMGVVYRAHDPDLDRPVAIKVLRPELRQARRRLLKEGQAVARLRHPHVITVYDVGVDGDDLFIAMELVDGGTLRHWLETARAWPAVVETFVAAGRGLAAAHAAGLVHRDFKPDNVLVGSDGRVVVGDFGIAQDAPEQVDLGAGDLERTHGIAGTPAYMAPEQFKGEIADARTDQFSFCIALWDALFGERPFRGADPSSVESLADAVVGGALHDVDDRRGVPKRIHRALRRGLSRKPADRWPSLDALLAELAPRRRRWVLPAAVIAAAVVAVAATLLLREPPERVVAAAPACATGPEVAAWDGAARAELAATIGPRSSVEQIRWFDAYQSAIAGWRSSRCVAAAIAAGSAADPVMPCLDAAAEDLRAGAHRPRNERRLWPSLRALRSCAPDAAAATTRVLLPQVPSNDHFRLSPDGTRLLVNHGGALPVVRDLATGHEIALPDGGILLWLDDARVVLADEKRMMLVTAATGAIEREVPLAGVMGASADLQRAITSDDVHMYLVEVAHPDQKTRLTDDDEAGRMNVGAWFSPDGAVLARISYGRGLELVLHDVAHGTKQRMQLRLYSPYGVLGIAWLGPREFMIGGVADYDHPIGTLWRVRLTDDLHLATAPEPVLTSDENSSFSPEGANGREVLVQRVTMGRGLEERWDGGVRSAPAGLSQMHPVWSDAAKRRVLGYTDERWGFVDLESWAVTPLPLSDQDMKRIYLPQVVGDTVLAMTVDQGTLTAAEIVDGAIALRPFPAGWVATHGAVLRCRGAHCLAYQNDADEIRLSRWKAGAFAAVERIPVPEGLRADAISDLDIALDGKRLAIVTDDERVFLWDRKLRPLEVADCGSVQMVRFTSDDKAVIVTCVAGVYALRRIELATGKVTVIASTTNTWYSSLSTFPDDHVLIGTQSHNSSLEVVTIP